MFPGLVLMGVPGSLPQAPMFAVAGTLSRDRATTGSAVLNMSRQVGSALGVAPLVAPTATSENVAGFEHAWAVQVGAGAVAAGSQFLLRPREACTWPQLPSEGFGVPGKASRAPAAEPPLWIPVGLSAKRAEVRLTSGPDER